MYSRRRMNVGLIAALGAMLTGSNSINFNGGARARDQRPQHVQDELIELAASKRSIRNKRRFVTAHLAALNEPVHLYAAKSFLLGPLHANREIKRRFTPPLTGRRLQPR